MKRIDIEAARAENAPRGAAIHFDETFALPPGMRLGESMGFARTDFTVSE